jgi:SpoIID/LytB domain protein
MSQYGAQAQALSGWDHARILGHWYPGTELTTHAAAERGIAVNLFLNRPEVATDHVVVQTAGGDGVDPNTVQLGEGAHVHAVPRPQAWTVRHDGEAFTLADASGTVVDRGPGPVVVRYGAQERPSRLRLPQLGTSDPLAGSFRWGTLRITVNDEGVLNPVIHLPVEAYLRGLAEMPSGWQPAALAAQAVAGRGYAVRQVLEGLDPVCDCHLGTTPHDQAYAGLAKEGGMFGDRWVDAVRSTTSQVLEYEGELAWTYYSSSHAGRTENSGDSWAYPETLPYLPSVDDPWSADPRAKNPMRTWEREIPNAEFSRHVGLARVLDVAVVERTEGGTPRVLAIRGLDADGNEVALDFRGWRKPIAGAHLKLSLRSTLPSMQIDAIEVLAP